MTRFIPLGIFLTVVAAGAGAANRPVVGVIKGDPLARLGIRPEQVRTAPANARVRFVGKTKYLNNSRAVVTHTMDDSNDFVL